MTIRIRLTFITHLINSFCEQKRLEKYFELKNAYQATIEKDLECSFVQKLDQEEIDNTEKVMQRYLTHHPVKPAQTRQGKNSLQRSLKVQGNFIEW